MEFQKLRLTFSRAYPSLYSTIYPLSQVSAPSIFTREGVDNAYPIPSPSSTSFQDFARSFRGNETRWNLSKRRRRRLIQSMLIHSWNNTFETYRVYQISHKIVPRWIKEYLEIRVVECNIFRILIVVDSFRANVLSFPFARLLGSRSFIEGENRQSRKYDRRDLSKRKERIHDKSFQRPIPNNGRLVEYHGSDVIAGNGDENCKVVHSIIELERFWLGRNPAVFFLSLSLLFSRRSFTRPSCRSRKRIYTEPFDFVYVSQTFAIRMKYPAMKWGWEPVVKLCRIFPRNSEEERMLLLPFFPWPRFHEQRGDICV